VTHAIGSTIAIVGGVGGVLACAAVLAMEDLRLVTR
jgi:hypothetical protein